MPTAWIPGARCLGQKYRSSTDRCEILEKFSRKGGIFCERCVVHVAKFCKCISVSLSLSICICNIYIIPCTHVHISICIYICMYMLFLLFSAKVEKLEVQYVEKLAMT